MLYKQARTSSLRGRGDIMNVSWDTILNAIGELDTLHSANEKKSESANKINKLYEQMRSLKRGLSAEKEVLEKKLKEAKQGEQRLWELLDKKNEETKLLDQSLVQAENEQSRLRDLLAQEISRITEMEKVSQDMKEAHKETAQENELLLLQLHKAQEELEAQFLSQKKDDIRVKQLRDEISRMQQTLSWRVTSPLRWVMWNFYKKDKCE